MVAKVDNVIVWQTPEPAMMLLMGLPALFLRRRRL
ncbi:MAG: PEP-CTERM sorting domain-containing protein [Phycisphaerae bacterium]|nr:PEP-CTERM sorting domain-containing protein [Phycisphaerae bacterium]